MDPTTIPLTFFRKASGVDQRARSTTSSNPRTSASSTTRSRSVWSSAATSRSAPTITEDEPGRLHRRPGRHQRRVAPATSSSRRPSSTRPSPTRPSPRSARALVLLDADELKRFGDLRLRCGSTANVRQNMLVDGDMIYRPAAGAAVADPVPGPGRGRSAAHRHPGRHRAERPAEADRDHRQPAAAGGEVEGVLQAPGQATRSTCSTATSWRLASPPTTAPSTSASQRTRREVRVTHARRRRPVVIVGAGPTGVTAATLLAQYGVDSLVLDRWPDVYPQPRAVHLDDEIYRILARLGIADEFAAISRPALGLRLLDNDHARAGRVQPRHRAQRATASRRPTCSTSPSSRRCCATTSSATRTPTLRGDAEVTDVDRPRRRARSASRSPTAPTAASTRSTPTTCWAATAPTASCAPRSAPPCAI